MHTRHTGVAAAGAAAVCARAADNNRTRHNIRDPSVGPSAILVVYGRYATQTSEVTLGFKNVWLFCNIYV